MMMQIEAARVGRTFPARGLLPRRALVRLAMLTVTLGLVSPLNAALSAETSKTPNVVLVFADDKYELG
ncbi:MAG TPA: hypothetical protein VHC19_08185 [Pirellulales bacterium]|nr:hypothetical protein [Pirellulales bacterium]